MRDLIFVSMEDWDEIWRRNQFICADLAKRYPDQKILFVGMPWDVSRHIRRGTLSELRKPISWKVEGLPNITVIQPLKFFPDSFAVGRWMNGLMSRIQIRRAARKLGMDQPILWLNPHSAVHMVGRMEESASIYDITDDWGLTPCFPKALRDRIKAQDRELCAKADLVIVCSEDLYKSRREMCREILLLPNGVDANHYAGVSRKIETNGFARPVFGYTGTLHPDRTDTKLIAALASAFPDGTVMLIGPDHLTPADRRVLAEHRNVLMPGPVPYAKIPEAMGKFDVCIVPHVETAFTESLNPIKLWEYLASGKPIVSTNIAGFRDYGQICHIASGFEGFIAGCRSALSDNEENREKRIAAASRNTWNSRVDTLLRTLAERQLLD